MEVFGDFVYLGGGGGYEIANKILCYKVPDTRIQLPLLKDLVHEVPTEAQVANYMVAARDVNFSNVLTDFIGFTDYGSVFN